MMASGLMIHIDCIDSLDVIAAADWNQLIPDNQPFLRHEFLVALERQSCVGTKTGWFPCHRIARDHHGQLVAAVPLYIKTNSYGELVFDWQWAATYERYGLRYYPKLVSAIPFTPVTGPRVLHQPTHPTAAAALIDDIVETARRQHFSSIHWLFNTDSDYELLQSKGFLRRTHYQCHWHNAGYRDFTDFLDTLSSKRRKNIKRERRLIQEAGLELQVLTGPEISEQQWYRFHQFYCNTFERLGGIATLTLPFFLEIAQTMGSQIVLVVAFENRQMVAAAISFRSDTTLYGRHWGCQAYSDHLHFEACYYQGIDYCIRHGLKRFEPGAQGEQHKIPRGFLPIQTQSAHWLAHEAFHHAIADFLQRETPLIEQYILEMQSHSPYRVVSSEHHPQ